MFKIIAIRPLLGCNPDFLKILTEEQDYLFFKGYKLDGDNISMPDDRQKSIYDTLKMSINISAIAGQNGSGKSTIIELVLMAINNLAYKLELKDDLVPLLGLKVKVFYEINSIFYILEVLDNEVEVSESNDGITWDSLNNLKIKQNFFFTIAINYSHYAFNSKDYSEIIYKGEEQGDWLTPLFHKNDAYQTPLVINPWREEGDIKINRENELVRSRLLANLLRKPQNGQTNFRKISDNLKATHLHLELNTERYSKALYKEKVGDENNGGTDSIMFNTLGEDDHDLVLKTINKLFDFNYSQHKNSQSPVIKLGLDYLISKLVTMSVKYDDYKDYYDKELLYFDMDLINEYIGEVLLDPSHITFKFKQMLNYLKYQHVPFSEGESLNEPSLEVLSIKIYEIIGEDTKQLILFLPPPIFRADIILQSLKQDIKKIWFKTLSSGEKQLAYSISSILYHLHNLNSVNIKGEKIKFATVNLVLEEIELYFHPEMQREYINRLTSSIRDIEVRQIKTMNICFVTHSPFILSDIPDSNVMFLKVIDGHAVQVNMEKRTFGANIHDLLADGFFMENGYCGAFAISKINETVSYLNRCREIKQLSEVLSLSDSQYWMVPKAELDELFSDSKKAFYKGIIDSVGEKVIAVKLADMYDTVFGLTQRDRILGEIDRLQKIIGGNDVTDR